MTAVGAGPALGSSAGIDASGIIALRKAFKAMGSKKFDRQLRAAHLMIAQQVVAASKPNVAAESRTVADAMEAKGSAAGARISISQADAPQAGGVIFGAYHNRWRLAGVRIRRSERIRHLRADAARKAGFFRGYNQFQPWRPGQAYHIFPELDELRDQIAADYVQVIDEFLSSEGVPG